MSDYGSGDDIYDDDVTSGPWHPGLDPEEDDDDGSSPRS